jgi:hypothetical protein
MDLVDLQRAGERAGIGQAADPAARESPAGEVPVKAPGSLAQLLVGGHHHRLRDRKPQPREQPLEGSLVMQTSQRAEGRHEHLRNATQALELGRDVERLLERRHDHVDLILPDDPLQLGDEARRVAARRRIDEMAGQKLRVVPRRQQVVIGGVDLAALSASLRTMPRANGIRELVTRTLNALAC